MPCEVIGNATYIKTNTPCSVPKNSPEFFFRKYRTFYEFSRLVSRHRFPEFFFVRFSSPYGGDSALLPRAGITRPFSTLPHVSMQRKHLTLPLLSFIFTSCGDEEIRTYKVATDEPSESTPATVEEAPHDHAAHSNSTIWQAPTGWEQEATGQFLVAAYGLPGGGRVTVSKLGGDGGGLAANVNRWRGQVGMKPISEEEIGGHAVPVPGSGRDMLLYNLAPESLAADADGILAAVLPLDSETWYFKFTAPTAVLKEKGGVFMDFLRTVRIAGETGESQPPQSPAPSAITATAPEGWEKSEGSAMRAASFAITGEDGATADVSVIPLPGSSGSVQDNVNRWRNQIGLPPIEAADDPALGKEVEGPSGKFFLSHMVSTEPVANGKKAAIGAAILVKPGKTWFFKITGEAGFGRSEPREIRRVRARHNLSLIFFNCEFTRIYANQCQFH